MAAENAVKKLGGVVGVSNFLTIHQPVGTSDIKDRIERALRRNAEIAASGIKVRVSDSKVVLEGGVHAWNERQAAEHAAWSVPGVTVVENYLHVG